MKDDLQTRPKSWNLQINEVKERIITAETYVKAMIHNMNEKFLLSSWYFLYIWFRESSYWLLIQWISCVLHYGGRNSLWILFWYSRWKRNNFTIEWDRFKFGLMSLRKKWFQSKKNLSRNKLKPDINVAKGFLN